MLPLVAVGDTEPHMTLYKLYLAGPLILGFTWQAPDTGLYLAGPLNTGLTWQAP